MIKTHFSNLIAISLVTVSLLSPVPAEEKKKPKEAASKKIDTFRLLGPYRHKNLELYLIKPSENHKPLPAGTSIITLEEGLRSGEVEVSETGNVNYLKIANHSKSHLYVHSGDIVKGGKQDRTLPNGFTLAPGSKPVTVAAFCVEKNRWEKRGNEDVKGFAASTKILNSVKLKQAAQVGISQNSVWKSVKSVQDKAAARAGSVRSTQSPTSLQLTLESDGYRKLIKEYTDALLSQISPKQIKKSVGCTFAIHGDFYSCDEFVSHELFGKMWPKLLDAMVAEAIAEFDSEKPSHALPKRDFMESIQLVVGASKEKKFSLGNSVSVVIGDKNIQHANQGTIAGSLLQMHRSVSQRTEFANPAALESSHDAFHGGVHLNIGF